MKEKILVLVRAMPQESRKYGHTVCVAGINDKGEWRRLYPFQFKYGERKISFRKKDMIAVELDDPDNDKRKESRKVKSHINLNDQKTPEEVRKIIIPFITSLKELDDKKASLGVVKPEILDFEVKVHNTEIMDDQKHLSLLAEGFMETREKVKLPIEARYIFKCSGKHECGCNKKPHKITLIDWELNELARSIMKTEKDKKIIEQKIKDKFLTWMRTRDMYFFMGTQFRWQTWLIIGIFYPAKIM